MAFRMQASLPRLAFGETRATHGGGVDGLAAAQRLTHRSLECYEPIGCPSGFSQKSAVVTIGGLRLAASAHTPVRVSVAASDDITLMVPLSGWSTAVIEGREHRWLAGRSAMFLPGLPRTGESGRRSTLTIGMEASRLWRAAGFLADAGEPAAIRGALTTPRVVPLIRSGFSFATALRRICGLIDSCLDQPHQLALLGVDEMVYRTVAMVLLPEQTVTAAAAQIPTERHPLGRVCDYIKAHLAEPIRLADLEAVSGIKARGLQLAFVKQFGRTPRQWILDRRLDAARARLLQPRAGQTLSSVTSECGLPRVSDFARAYEARFGERPAATAMRVHGR